MTPTTLRPADDRRRHRVAATRTGAASRSCRSGTEPEGTSPPPASGEKELRELYRLMAPRPAGGPRGHRAPAAGRAGRVPAAAGQEAAQVGSAFALADRLDLPLVPGARRGRGSGRGHGRVPPLLPGHVARGHVRRGRPSVRLRRRARSASQVLHAVGDALGAKLDGGPRVAWSTSATARPRRATSTRAATSPACSGRRWCSSARTTSGPSRCRCRSQTAAPIWRKAEAYGFPGRAGRRQRRPRRVPGHARGGGTGPGGRGPTLIEAVTYRIGRALHGRRRHALPDRGGGRALAGAATRSSGTGAWLEAERPVDDGVLRDRRWRRRRRSPHGFGPGVIASEPRPVEELFQWVFEASPRPTWPGSARRPWAFAGGARRSRTRDG